MLLSWVNHINPTTKPAFSSKSLNVNQQNSNNGLLFALLLLSASSWVKDGRSLVFHVQREETASGLWLRVTWRHRLGLAHNKESSSTSNDTSVLLSHLFHLLQYTLRKVFFMQGLWLMMKNLQVFNYFDDLLKFVSLQRQMRFCFFKISCKEIFFMQLSPQNTTIVWLFWFLSEIGLYDV